MNDRIPLLDVLNNLLRINKELTRANSEENLVDIDHGLHILDYELNNLCNTLGLYKRGLEEELR